MKGILIAILLLALIGFGLYWLIGDDNGTSLNGEGDATFCTLDAMLCPDGSYVGRIPPSCQFAQCPTTGTTTPNTSTSTATSSMEVRWDSYLLVAD